MLTFVNKYASNHVYSQNGEEGILEECLLRVWDTRHDVHCVEIGGSDGHFCSNTAHLIEQGAHGLFVESDFSLYQKCVENWKHNPKVRVQCSHVDGNNINAFVDDSCDVFSSDTDGADYEIFKGLKAKPKIVIVEIDSSIPPYVAGREGFNSDGAAGYAEMVMLGYRKGYFLLCHTGNLVFVDTKYQSLFPEITANPLSEAFKYFKRDWLKAA